MPHLTNLPRPPTDRLLQPHPRVHVVAILALLAATAPSPGASAARRLRGGSVFRCARELWREVEPLRVAPRLAQLDSVVGAAMRYRDYEKEVEGNMIWAMSLSLSSKLAQFQLSHGISGSVGEIGTYYGKYFFSIATAALPEEPKVDIDLFEAQHLNVDRSGGFVDSGRFRRHAAALGVANLTLLSQDSSTVTINTFVQMGTPAFRLFSVDGAHTFEATLRDLQLAACAIKRGGVIVLDDWLNMDWTGVVDASFQFLHNAPSIVPFLFLYLTTREFHPLYLAWAQQLPCLHCSSADRGMHSSRYELAGTPVCMDVRSGCGGWCG
ncbi:hypothetical protein HYH03_007256 [Edaphochlamys debaryana]|uniref:Uncharacterized protein n=1 Tax=Edaphochlamys debaryana TaxID=47281 RepID=A0A836C004_9CHLO|nr:hypothetical protein HYH03_007256 [Edaphochlamys debaryana]|eukprot:KAG2494487.1 hypothetical protein HYH03_007256 [Edaphochlamys debaryana]